MMASDAITFPANETTAMALTRTSLYKFID